MRGIFQFILIGLFLSFFCSSAFSAYPGDDLQCPPVIYREDGSQTNNAQNWYSTATELNGVITSGNLSPGPIGYRISWSVYYWESGSWHKKIPTYSGYYNTLSPQDFTTISHIPTNSSSCVPDEPSCSDNEKLCEWMRLVDVNNIIVKSSYVTYENRNADVNTVSTLDYTSPLYNFAAEGNTTYLTLNPKTCMCPDDSEVPSDLQNNFSVSAAGDTKAPDTVTNFDCAQKCFPKGYIYSDGKCVCVDDGAKTETASTPPGSPTSENPADAPADPTDSAQQLGAVNENLGSMINQGNQSNEYLSNIAGNLATSVNNQQGIVDGIGGLGDQIGNDFSGLGEKLDSIQDQQSQGYNLEGTADLPTDNTYDPVVDDVEEDSLTDAITQYMASGIPVLSYINGSGATIANATSSMNVSIWGGTVTFDLAPMGNILDTMGYFLSAISMIVGFFIITGRG